MRHHRAVWYLAGLLAALAATAAGEQPAATAAPGFERFRALAGEWIAASDNQMAKPGDLVARYSVTGSGSAVVETLFPGTPHEMLTVYTSEGSDIVLTHYCAGGNQPRMRAKGGAAGGQADFAFDGGSNIDLESTDHMHSATVWFVGPDELRNEWRALVGRQPGMVVKMHLVRKAG
jgi:hypothetical protein